MTPTVVVPIGDPSQVGAARRAANALGAAAGDQRKASFALVATELATNLLRHARDGALVVQPHGDGLELLSLDRGPGSANFALYIRDGVSRSTSLGSGLGAVARATDMFDWYSRVGVGTVVAARIAGGSGADRTEHAALIVPLRGETLSGDGWALRETPGGTWLLLVDGLGHGVDAAAAAGVALDAFRPRQSPGEVVEDLHSALRGTRGAAVACAFIDHGRGSVIFAGAGNIAGLVTGPAGQTQRLLSHNGTAGVALGRVGEQTVGWSPDATLVMHTDGLRSSWSPDDFPGLFSRHPAVVAGVLYRDLARGTDDAGVVVVRGRQ